MVRSIAGKSGVIALALVAALAVAVPAYATWTGTHRKAGVVAAGTSWSTGARCAAGEHAVAGGIDAPVVTPVLDAGPTVFPQAMLMNGSQTGWSVTAANGGATGGTLAARVYCDSHPQLRTVVRQRVAAPHNEITTAIAVCPAGKVVLGAGFSTPARSAGKQSPPVAIITGLRATPHTVKATIAVGGPTTVLTAYAYCGAGPAPTETAASVNNLEGTQDNLKSATATCPPGKHFVFGGFHGEFVWPDTGAEVTPYSMSSPSIGKWTVNAYNPWSDPGSLTAYAYCR